jgi:hypothetical protein
MKSVVQVCRGLRSDRCWTFPCRIMAPPCLPFVIKRTNRRSCTGIVSLLGSSKPGRWSKAAWQHVHPTARLLLAGLKASKPGGGANQPAGGGGVFGNGRKSLRSAWLPRVPTRLHHD